MSNLTAALRSAIEAGDAIVRIHAHLTPASGSKILPPTYAGGGHNMTAPREDGSSEWCSVDSPASFANRVEAVGNSGILSAMGRILHIMGDNCLP